MFQMDTDHEKKSLSLYISVVFKIQKRIEREVNFIECQQENFPCSHLEDLMNAILVCFLEDVMPNMKMLNARQ